MSERSFAMIHRPRRIEKFCCAPFRYDGVNNWTDSNRPASLLIVTEMRVNGFLFVNGKGNTHYNNNKTHKIIIIFLFYLFLLMKTKKEEWRRRRRREWMRLYIRIINTNGRLLDICNTVNTSNERAPKKERKTQEKKNNKFRANNSNSNKKNGSMYRKCYGQSVY